MNEQNLAVGRRERKREETRARLVKAAMDLFVAKGYDETSIDDIAAAADVAKVTFYYHFRAKEDVVLEIKKICAAQTSEAAERLLLEGASASEILGRLARDISGWVESNSELVEILVAQKHNPPIGKDACMNQETPPLVLLFERIISSGKRTGEFREDMNEAEIAHFLTLSMMHQNFMWIRAGKQKSQLRPSIERWIDFALHGVMKS